MVKVKFDSDFYFLIKDVMRRIEVYTPFKIDKFSFTANKIIMQVSKYDYSYKIEFYREGNTNNFSSHFVTITDKKKAIVRDGVFNCRIEWVEV